jgi:protein O-GlcNAc transferase
LQALGRHAEALQNLQQVLKLRPDDARALFNAGILLLVFKRFDEASVLLSRAVRLNPGNGDALGSLASAALRACDWRLLDEIHSGIFSGIESGGVIVPPLSVLALTDDAGIQRRSSELNLQRILVDTALTGANPMPLAQSHYDHPKLRVGYLSSEFGEHPVAAQIVGLLESHDRAGFEVVGLFTGHEDKSDRFRRVTAACDRFYRLNRMSDRQAAIAIREAEIDILVDLNGHTMGWRPAILKYRPAPVIAAYLGYAGSTGADFVDYIIGDPHVTPFGLARGFSEKIVQLPDTFWPTDPALPEPARVGRAELGLPQDAFVFCCFNANHKIRPRLFDSWARILNSIPQSLLWIRDGSPAMNERFRQEARVRGIDAGRMRFAGRTDSLALHFGRQAEADLFLDTFPYNAHATASDALWSGLPVLTLRGNSFVSRVAAGFLVNLGLEELIATSFDDYEAKAIALARDGGLLVELRERLARARTSSPLFDCKRLAKSIEAAYRQMHARAVRGEPPAPFRVD